MELPVKKFLTKIVGISKEFGQTESPVKKETLKSSKIQPKQTIPPSTTPVRAASPVVKRLPHLDKCFKYLRKLMMQKNSYWFLNLVDPVALNIPNYFDVVKKPMDFSTIKSNIDSELYKNEEEFAEDVSWFSLILSRLIHQLVKFISMHNFYLKNLIKSF